MGRARRLEISLALILALSLAGLAVLRGVRPGRTTPPREPGSTAELASLACLKEVLEDTAAAAPAPAAGATFEEVASAVEHARALQFEQRPEPAYLRRAELSERVSEYADEYSDIDADEDERILAALGAIEPGTDLKALLRTALGEQVIGFYDPDTRELVVGVGDASRLGFLERVTLAHELEHALADQALGLPLEREEVAEGQEDRQAAAISLIEGDATLTMTIVAFAAPAAAGTFEEGLGVLERSRVTELPHHVQRSLLFSYEEGLGLVCHLYRGGGWDAVNAAYSEPPVSTAEVLFPERYGSGTLPADPADPGEPGAGWIPRTTQAFGAAELLFLLEAPGGDPERALESPRDLTSAWRGGEVHLWTRGEASAVGVALTGEASLCGTMRAWYRAAFPRERVRERAALLESEGPGHSGAVRCHTGEVRIGIAPTPGEAVRIAA